MILNGLTGQVSNHSKLFTCAEMAMYKFCPDLQPGIQWSTLSPSRAHQPNSSLQPASLANEETNEHSQGLG